MWQRGKLAFILILFEIIFIFLFATFVKYDEEADARSIKTLDAEEVEKKARENSIYTYYPQFQDIHVMIFIGFAYLMTFLKKYGYSSIGINFILGAFVLQWSLLIRGCFDMFQHGHDKISISITTMINAEFFCAIVLISFGAVLGKVTPLQLIVMSIIEIQMGALNEWLGVEIFQILDIGGSIFLHTFGAYFGLAVTRILYRREMLDHPKEGSIYHSDIFAMIGTVFIWIFWPSFNSGLAVGEGNHRGVINTYLSLAACCITTFAISSLVDKRNKFDMVHVQNSSLAGAVAIGCVADLMIHPFGAMIIGSCTGAISVLGYKFLTPFLAKNLKIHDTCGINNLHGMPGILAGITSAIVAATASEKDYGVSLYRIFAARAPLKNSTKFEFLHLNCSLAEPGLGRTALEQAGYQIIVLVITLCIALVGGTITGFILRIPCFDPPPFEEMFDDHSNWKVPKDEEVADTANISIVPIDTKMIRL